MPVTKKKNTGITCWKTGVSEPISCPENTTACYASWIEKNGTVSIKNQNCFRFEDEGASSDRCSGSICKSYAEKSHENGVTHTCCCKADLCNEHVFPRNISVNIPTYDTTHSPSLNTSNKSADYELKPLFLPVIIIVVLCMVLATVYYGRKRGAKCLSSEKKNSEIETSPELADLITAPEGDDTKLYEGRFGKIYLIKLKSENCPGICIKEFYTTTAQGLNMYKTEEECQQILRQINHKNIVRYYGVVLLPNSNKGISMEYCALGSLRNYLHHTVIDLTTCIGFLLDITEAISYLHTPDQPELLRCIAHRDITSSNFLLRENLTVVISDFGLSRVFWKNNIKSSSKTENAVGTLNYMAPEILSGNINLHQYESAIKKADVYSTALVMWEVVSRCEDFYGNVDDIPIFTLPYEAEMKHGQSLYDIVVTQKLRPKMNSTLRTVIKSHSIRSSSSDDSGNVSDNTPESPQQSDPKSALNKKKTENPRDKKRTKDVGKNVFYEHNFLSYDEFTKAVMAFKECNIVRRTIQESWDPDEDTRLTAANMRDRIRRCVTSR